MLWAVFTPVLAALLCAWLGPRLGRRTGYLAALGFVPALLLALSWGQPIRSETLNWVPALGLNLTLRGDGFGLLFAVVIGLIGALACLYSVAYLSDDERFGRFYSYLLAFGGSMLGLVLSDNLIALFGFWELTSITSFLLIGLWHTRSAARDGAVKALLVSVFGGLALLASVAMLIVAGGSVNFSELDLSAVRASSLFTPALLLALLAAFTKSAQLPFHLWLPTAMEAPTPVSAFLHSATMVKAGVFLVAKFGLIFAASPLWPALIVPLGLATLFWGAYLALMQTDLKALLAYSTVSQLGLLMSLYGLATPESNFSASVHLLNHAAFKAALFFVVGIVDHACGTRSLLRLGGLRRMMPLTFVAALIASFSMAGLPPLGGFISKELFYETMLHTHWGFLAVAVVGSALTLAYSFRLLSVFVGRERFPSSAHPHEAGVGLLLSPALLAAAALLFGLYPASAEALARVAAPALGFASYGEHLSLWHGFTLALLATVVTWGLGALVLWQRRRVTAWQESLEPRWNANTAYYGLLGGIDRLATNLTTYTQGLALPDQLRIMLLAAAGLGGWAVLRAPQVWHPLTDLPLYLLPIAALIVAGATGVLLSGNRLTAVIVVGLTGFGSAVAFLALGAPDLALTQVLVETVTVILFLLVLRALPGIRDLPRTRGRRWLDVGLAALAGSGVTALVLTGVNNLKPSLSDFYIQNAYKGGGGKNVVNVILVDFRGWDTLGEVLVVGMVAYAVVALVRLGRSQPDQLKLEPVEPEAQSETAPLQKAQFEQEGQA